VPADEPDPEPVRCLSPAVKTPFTAMLMTVPANMVRTFSSSGSMSVWKPCTRASAESDVLWPSFGEPLYTVPPEVVYL
jgi:hypothetical protein